MTSTVAILIFLVGLLGAAYAFVNTHPADLANLLRKIVPMFAMALSFLFILAGRVAIGFPLLIISGLALAKSRRATTSSSGKPHTSTVRSDWLEMQLDHETGNLNGLVLRGERQGEQLSDMNAKELYELYSDLSGDEESTALLEAYLDRRIPRWRNDAQSHGRTRAGNPLSSGTMTKEEAYQILGLESGASRIDIRSAHRRLMKSVHPDSGGSTYLATRINQAKDTLLK